MTNKKIYILIAFLLLFSFFISPVSAEQNKVSNILKQKADNYQDSEALLKEGTEKINEIVNTVWLKIQAISIPAFRYSSVGGLIILVFGLIIGFGLLKKIGTWLLIFAGAQLVLINFAPDLASKVITFVSKLFSS